MVCVMPKPPTKAQLAAAVKTAQLYNGSLTCTSIRQQQRLYGRLMTQATAIARRAEMGVDDVLTQVTDHARKLGPLCPVPGKDI